MTRILVVEDDAAILRGLSDNLEEEGYSVLRATDGEQGLRSILESSPSLVILDLMLPKMNGYEVARRARAEGYEEPILMLTARSEEGDRVLGLDLGADDYVTKPFSIRELLARIRVLLRRARPSRSLPERLAFDDVYVIATDGTDNTRVAAHPAVDRVIGFSPDNERLLFLSERSGIPGLWNVTVDDDGSFGAPESIRPDLGPVTGLGITSSGALYYSVSRQTVDGWMVDLDGDALGSPPRQIVERVDSGERVTWSPDGRRLAYLSTGKSLPDSLARADLVIRDLSTDDERTLKLPFSVRPPIPHFTPDGKAVLLHGEDPETRQGLYRVELASGESDLLITTGKGEQPEPVYWIGWSSDGGTMYWIRHEKDGDTLVARDLSSGRDRTLYAARGLSGLAVSPDGKEIAVRDWTDDYTKLDLIRAIPVDGGEPRDVLREPVRNEGGHIFSKAGLVWTPDGDHLLFGRWERWPSSDDVDLYRVAAAGGASEPLGIGDMGTIWNLRLRPDGRRLAFTTRHGTGELWVLENFLPE